jgi:hypothetical protein
MKRKLKEHSPSAVPTNRFSTQSRNRHYNRMNFLSVHTIVIVIQLPLQPTARHNTSSPYFGIHTKHVRVAEYWDIFVRILVTRECVLTPISGQLN